MLRPRVAGSRADRPGGGPTCWGDPSPETTPSTGSTQHRHGAAQATRGHLLLAQPLVRPGSNPRHNLGAHCPSAEQRAEVRNGEATEAPPLRDAGQESVWWQVKENSNQQGAEEQASESPGSRRPQAGRPEKGRARAAGGSSCHHRPGSELLSWEEGSLPRPTQS